MAASITATPVATGTATTSVTIAASGSITLTAGQWFFAQVDTRKDFPAPGVTTMTGWTLVATGFRHNGTNYQVDIFKRLGAGETGHTPTAVNVQICDELNIAVWESVGCNDVVQSNNGVWENVGTSPQSGTLSAFADATNNLAAMFVNTNNTGMTREGGYTDLGSDTSQAQRRSAAYKVGQDTSIVWTFSPNMTGCWVAVEISAATASSSRTTAAAGVGATTVTCLRKRHMATSAAGSGAAATVRGKMLFHTMALAAGVGAVTVGANNFRPVNTDAPAGVGAATATAHALRHGSASASGIGTATVSLQRVNEPSRTTAAAGVGHAVATGHALHTVSIQPTGIGSATVTVHAIRPAAPTVAGVGTAAITLGRLRHMEVAVAGLGVATSRIFSDLIRAIALHSLTVAIPSPHTLTVAMRTRHIISPFSMDRFTTDNARGTTDQDGHTTDDAPLVSP